MSIGFFDSGIGGLTVLKLALKQMPEEDYIYYADTDNVPYGPKSKEEVRKFVFDAAAYITGKGVHALVVACNTATSVVIEDLRRQYSIPIIGMEPAVKPAVEKNGNKHKRVLVFATELTLREEKFRNLVNRIDDEKIIDSLPLPGLVTFAENQQFDEGSVMAYLKDSLKDFDLNRYGTVVLGCTHFIYFKNILRKLLPLHIEIIDGNAGTVNYLKRTLEAGTGADYHMTKAGEKGKCTYETSGRITFFESGREITDANGLDKYHRLLDCVPD